MRISRPVLVLMILVMGSVVGCDQGAGEDTTTPTTMPPTSTTVGTTTTEATTTTTTTTTAATTTTTVPPSTVPVSGTLTCRITTDSEQVEEGRRTVFEHFSCTVMASDPRVSGQYEADIITTLDPPYAWTAGWTGTMTLTNEGGTWRGTCEGALVFWSPGSPTNYGEGTYTGEGGYAGLTYHELAAGSNADIVIAGWIETQQ